MNPLFILLAGMVVVVGGILWLRLHAFLALILGAMVVAALTPAEPIAAWGIEQGMTESAAASLATKNFAERVALGFGRGCAKIGILISMAAIIGKCLMDSGAAERIVFSIRRRLGDDNAPAAFTASGFLLGIPVYFDTVFYLLMPLGKTLAQLTGKNYLLYILAIVAGATMAHSLVPPTPGPLVVADKLGVNLGAMMIGGCVVGIISVAAGYAYALWANRRWVIPLRMSDEDRSRAEGGETSVGFRDEASLPSLGLSLLPILLPAGLIIIDRAAAGFGWGLPAFVGALGNKNVALMIGAACGLVLLGKQSGRGLRALSGSVQDALMSGGIIILITGAGSGFGTVLHQSGVAGALGQFVPESQLLLLVLAFGVTSLVRIAQGSATVAMMTSVGIVGPVIMATPLAFHPVYVALAIGCGSKPVMWMNDSGFWIIGRITGMTELETLKTASVMMTIMGFAGLAAVLLGATFLPF